MHRQQRQQRDGLQQVGGDDRAPQVPTIGEAAAVRAKGDPYDQLDKEYRRGVSSGTRFREDEDRQRQGQQPVANVVDQRAAEHEAEIAVVPKRTVGHGPILSARSHVEFVEVHQAARPLYRYKSMPVRARLSSRGRDDGR